MYGKALNLITKYKLFAIWIAASTSLNFFWPGQLFAQSEVHPAEPKESGAENQKNAAAAGPSPSQTVKSLTVDEQKRFLQTRVPGSLIGKFGSFAGLFYALEGVLIGTPSKKVLEIQLHGVYPKKEIYQPTYEEFFETIARQTETSFSYQPDVNVWLFDAPAMPLPFSLTKAPDWTEENRGQYVAYIPTVAPVGMDIYMMGKYSALSDEKAKNIREFLALSFSQAMLKTPTIDQMKNTTIDGAEALYLESAGKAPETRWRQWAFIKNGCGFIIVSAYRTENEKTIVPAVDAMIKSFHTTETNK